MTLTDEELDRDWQPSGRRPQSKQTVDKNTEELASLEARIREMEDRLRRSVGGSTQQRSPLPQVQTQTANQSQTQQQQPSSLDAPTDDSKARSRPGTARAAQQAPSSGNMPPTPGASEGEYYVVTRDDLQDGPR
ncbi:hypothetical protein FOMA001_g10912 [Fusarium oxysporum f. sp. matthiolae]|nr:hypothetical protein FOMA001_g10912 [Fusarium oxysporum f. sp. matthiolae]